jgi:hypothetical protein
LRNDGGYPVPKTKRRKQTIRRRSSKQVAANPLADLAARIAAEHRAFVAAVKRGLEHAIAAGHLLIKAKDRLGHGEWLPWLSDHCQVPERTAQLYMRLARHAPELARKSATVADLTLREAAVLLTEHRVIADRAIEHRDELVAPVLVVPVLVGQPIEHRLAIPVAVTLSDADDYAERLADDDVEQITRCISQLASTADKFDLAFIVARIPPDRQAEVAKDLADIQHFAALLGEALNQAAASATRGSDGVI